MIVVGLIGGNRAVSVETEHINIGQTENKIVR